MSVGKNIIYALCEPSGEVRYVGKSVSGLSRPREHFKPSKYNKQEQPVYKWMFKRINNGIRPIIKVLVETETKEALFEEEMFMISYLRSLGVRLLNLTDGGEGSIGRKTKDSTRQLISAARRRNHADPEMRKVYDEARAKVMADPVTRQKISTSSKKRWASPEERRKQAERKKGCRQYHFEKAVVDQDGNIYPSITAAAKQTGIPRTTLNGYLKGRGYHLPNNYSFKYLNKKES